MKELNHYLKRLNYILNKIFKILFFLLFVYAIMNKNRGVVYMENNNENQNVSDINLEEVKEINNDEQIKLSNNIDKLDQEVSNQNLESQIVQKEEKKKKKLSKDQMIVICVIVALIVIIGILAWMLLFNNKDDNSTNNTQNNEVNNKQEDVINTFEEDDEESEEKEESKYTANIYVSKYDNLCEASDYFQGGQAR